MILENAQLSVIRFVKYLGCKYQKLPSKLSTATNHLSYFYLIINLPPFHIVGPQCNECISDSHFNAFIMKLYNSANIQYHICK